MTAPTKRALAQLPAARDGGSATEFALLMPIAVAMLVLMFDLGTGGYVKSRVQSAAQAGTTYVEQHGWNQIGIIDAVRAATNLQAVKVNGVLSCGCVNGTAIADVPCGGGACPNGAAAGVYATVTASSVYTPLFPYPGLARSMTLSATSVVRIN
jgi:Flp pilus assembly protein TadG